MGLGWNKSGTRQPVHADLAGLAVRPQLDQLLDGEYTGQILNAAADERMAAFCGDAGVDGLPAI